MTWEGWSCVSVELAMLASGGGLLNVLHFRCQTQCFSLVCHEGLWHELGRPGQGILSSWDLLDEVSNQSTTFELHGQLKNPAITPFG